MNLIATYKITWFFLIIIVIYMTFTESGQKIESVWPLYAFGFTVFFWSFGWAVRWPEDCVCLVISLKVIQICCLGVQIWREKAPISSAMSVCLSACISMAPTGWTIMKLDLWDFYENLLRNSKFGWNWTIMLGTLHIYQGTFVWLKAVQHIL